MRLALSALVITLACDAPAELEDAGAALDVPVSDAGMDASSDAADAGHDAAVPMRVLFVGNSYTYQNDLPSVVRDLADASGVVIETEMIAEGGASLWSHYVDGAFAARIAEGGVDHAVIQGQSTEPLLAGLGFQTAAGELSLVLAEHDVPATWFATWPRRPGHELYDRPGIGTPENMSTRIEGYYRTAAWENRDFLARVGAAWLIALDELPDIDLYDPDGSHPSAAGTLLAACVLVQGTSGLEPRLPESLSVSRSDAERLCALAPRVACTEGWTFCRGKCVFLRTDAEHCGACDVACPGMEPCRDSVCGCPDGSTPCARSCVDLETNRVHCGACGNVCDHREGRACLAGSCVCQSLSIENAGFVLPDHPECSSPPTLDTATCRAEARLACASRDCFQTAFGPAVVPGHGPAVVCLDEGVLEITFAELATFVPTCDGVTDRDGVGCAQAIHLYCESTGAMSGFGGPVDDAGEGVSVTCLDEAVVVRVPGESILSPFPGCDGARGWACTGNAWNQCSTLGHAGGFGPIAVVGDEVDVVCMTE